MWFTAENKDSTFATDIISREGLDSFLAELDREYFLEYSSSYTEFLALNYTLNYVIAENAENILKNTKICWQNITLETLAARRHKSISRYESFSFQNFRFDLMGQELSEVIATNVSELLGKRNRKHIMGAVMFEIIYQDKVNCRGIFKAGNIEGIAAFLRRHKPGYFREWEVFNTSQLNGERFHSTMQHDFCIAESGTNFREQIQAGYRYDSWIEEWLVKCEAAMPMKYTTNYHWHQRSMSEEFDEFLTMYGDVFTVDELWSTDNTDIDSYWHFWSDSGNNIVVVRFLHNEYIYGRITEGYPLEFAGRY